MQSYFIWNGQDSRAMGLILRRAAPLIRPEERVRHVSSPGLSGDVTELEGDQVYNSYIQTLEFSVDGSRKNSAINWLKGAGFVTFSGEPDRRQPARVIGAITLNKVSRNLDRWSGQLQFYCQPLKQRIWEATETLTAAGSVWNGGDVPSLPLIVATPASGASTVTLTVGGRTLTLTHVDGARKIDGETQEVSNLEGTALYTVYSAGPFPLLQPGLNAVSFTGCSSVQITKRERFL